MAIQIDLSTSNYGVPFAGAYFRIVTSSISRQRNAQFSVMIDVVGYATKPENDDTKDIDFRRYHAPLEEVEAQAGSTFLEKTYNWVTSQADMSGAVAV
jgi:hypothetical protein